MNPLGGGSSKPHFSSLGGKMRCKINKIYYHQQIERCQILQLWNIFVILQRFSRKVAGKG